MEAPGAPSLPTFSGRSAPPWGEGVSYRVKITASEHWVSPSLPATRPGALGQPPRTSLRGAPLRTGQRVGRRLGDARPPRRTRPGGSRRASGGSEGRAGRGAGGGLAAPAVPPVRRSLGGGRRGEQEEQPSGPAPGRVQAPDPNVREKKKKNRPYKPFSLQLSYL